MRIESIWAYRKLTEIGVIDVGNMTEIGWPQHALPEVSCRIVRVVSTPRLGEEFNGAVYITFEGGCNIDLSGNML